MSETNIWVEAGASGLGGTHSRLFPIQRQKRSSSRFLTIGTGQPVRFPIWIGPSTAADQMEWNAGSGASNRTGGRPRFLYAVFCAGDSGCERARLDYQPILRSQSRDPRRPATCCTARGRRADPPAGYARSPARLSGSILIFERHAADRGEDVSLQGGISPRKGNARGRSARGGGNG